MKRIFTLLTTATISLAMTMTVAAASKSIEVNGAKLDEQSITLDNVELMPVRAVAEKLGMEVNWDADNKSISLAKMPTYVTFTVGTDGYTFAKTAPQSLGTAPAIIDGKTYVPAALFSEIMSLEVATDGDTLSISVPTDEATAENSSTVSVSEIGEDSITVLDSELGEVTLVPNDATAITDSNGNTVSIDTIKVGDTLEVTYGEAMTMSLPPINNPALIVVK